MNYVAVEFKTVALGAIFIMSNCVAVKYIKDVSTYLPDDTIVFVGAQHGR